MIQQPSNQPIEPERTSSEKLESIGVLLTSPFWSPYMIITSDKGLERGAFLYYFMISVGAFFALAFIASKLTRNKRIVKIALLAWISGVIIASFVMLLKNRRNGDIQPKSILGTGHQ